MINKTKDEIISDLLAALRLKHVSDEYDDATMRNWFEFCWFHNSIYFKYDDDGNLMGFVDGIRVHRVPHSPEEFQEILAENPYNIGTVGVLMNAIVLSGKDTYKLLYQIIKEDNPDWTTCVWRREHTGKFVVRTNIRRNHAE